MVQANHTMTIPSLQTMTTTGKEIDTTFTYRQCENAYECNKKAR